MLKRLVVASAVLAFVSTTSGIAGAQSKCSSAKTKTAGKGAAGVGKCFAKAIGKGVAVDPACTSKETGKISSGFTKAEGKGDCLAPNGDAGAITAKVNALVDDLHQAVNSGAGGPSKCDSKKIQTATKKAADKAGCHAKAVGKGIAVDAACLTKAEGKFSSATAKNESGTTGATCTNTGQAAALEAIVDAFIADLVDELAPSGPGCCSATRIETTSGPGLLAVSTLPPFPFPAGVVTKIDAGAPDSCCKHGVSIPPGGFNVPVFCIPALGFTSQVVATGCAAGTGLGNGSVWDAAAGSTLPCCADGDVTRVGDTSDPSTNSCGTLGTTCAGPVTAGSAGFDTDGNINTTRGNGACDPGGGVGVQLDIPVESTTWNAVDASCPDGDGTYNAGTDTLVTQFEFILSPTSASSNADYTDLNSDSCSFQGNGPDHVKHCSSDASRPCTTNGHCTGFGTCVDGAIVGIPAAGPCCTVGQSTTVVASGIAFTGGAPLYDIVFANQTPSTISACGSPASNTCTLSTDACQD
jgi:hypothetical protein